MAATELGLEAFTAEHLKNDLRFELGGEGSSFRFAIEASFQVDCYCPTLLVYGVVQISDGSAYGYGLL